MDNPPDILKENALVEGGTTTELWSNDNDPLDVELTRESFCAYMGWLFDNNIINDH
jgi:hypothetical protein